MLAPPPAAPAPPLPPASDRFPLACVGAAVVCYDGFAAYPKLSSPWDVVERERVTHMGTSPRFFQACRKRVRPMEDNDLSALRVVFSTGSPLLPEDFEYVYSKVKSDVMLASISGGTDICSCFALGNPTLPVRKGELQAFGLGLDACAFDRDSGRAMVGSKAAAAPDMAGEERQGEGGLRFPGRRRS